MAREIIDSVEKLEAELDRVRAAQREFATYTQEQVDKIFFAAAMAANSPGQDGGGRDRHGLGRRQDHQEPLRGRVHL